MLHLTVVRHAKAEPARTADDDWDRALDAHGQQEALQIGRRLRQRGVQPSSVLSSSAVRAISTANLLAQELGLPAGSVIAADDLYLISATDLLAWIQEREAADAHLLLVAHNPGLSEFAARIAVHPTVNNLPTAAALTLRFDIQHWSELRWGSGEDARLEVP